MPSPVRERYLKRFEFAGREQYRANRSSLEKPGYNAQEILRQKSMLIFVVLASVNWLLLSKTVTGRYLYAMGLRGGRTVAGRTRRLGTLAPFGPPALNFSRRFDRFCPYSESATHALVAAPILC